MDKRTDAERRQAIDDLLNMKEDIHRLVGLLKDIESFLRVVATVGHGVKWLAGICAATFGAYLAWKGISK